MGLLTTTNRGAFRPRPRVPLHSCSCRHSRSTSRFGLVVSAICALGAGRCWLLRLGRPFQHTSFVRQFGWCCCGHDAGCLGPHYAHDFGCAASIGYWALNKLRSDLSTPEKAQQDLDHKPIPVVKHGGALYSPTATTRSPLDASGSGRSR